LSKTRRSGFMVWNERRRETPTVSRNDLLEDTQLEF